jgi:hypothetical protein
MNYDLTNSDQRKMYKRELENSLITDLKKKLNMSDNAICLIHRTSLIICTNIKDDKRIDFGSEVNLYRRNDDDTLYQKEESRIDYGSSGSFSPSNKASYWRTIHAAEILKEWDYFIEVSDKYFHKIDELMKVKVTS